MLQGGDFTAGNVSISTPRISSSSSTLTADRAPVVSPSTVRSSRTRTSLSSTPAPVSSPWPTPAPTRKRCYFYYYQQSLTFPLATAPNSSSALRRLRGWTASTLSSARSSKAWTLSRRSRPTALPAVPPRPRSPSPTAVSLLKCLRACEADKKHSDNELKSFGTKVSGT